MRYAYPCTLKPEKEGGFVVSFPDVPEALTGGVDRKEALEMAEDALAVALGSYVSERLDVPVPSALAAGQILVPVPSAVAAKLALYSAVRAEGLSNATLAEQLGITESAACKLADPRHSSRIDNIEDGLRFLGRRLVIEDEADQPA